MKYIVEYVPAKQLGTLKSQWNVLEHGKEMTLFQSFQWYQMLAEYYIPADTNNYTSVFAVVQANETPCLIAPFWIVKHTFKLLNKKGVYLLGRDSYGDYLNLVYDQFDGAALDFLLEDVSKKYGTNHFVFEQLMESSSTYHHIVKTGRQIMEDRIEPCASLRLPASVGDYQKMLSKNARQNLRTANNRLAKDGKILAFNFDDVVTDKNSCLNIRESKLAVKYAKVPIWRKYKYRLVNKVLFHFPRFAPIQTFDGSKVMTAKDEEGLLRAFFSYGYDTEGRCVRIMSAGTDLEFARYSPGMLLMHTFIIKTIEDGLVHEIDFTRGDEKYKFTLGSVLQNNHTITFGKS